MLWPNVLAGLANPGIWVPHAVLAEKSQNLALELDSVSEKSKLDADVFASGWVNDCVNRVFSKARNTQNRRFSRPVCYLCLEEKFEIGDPRNGCFCSNVFDGSGRCPMEQLIGQLGHTGPFDLTTRPRTNARMVLSAVTLSGKKDLLAK